MTRDLGDQLPNTLQRLLDGSDLAGREGSTFLLLTTDAEGWAHMALLSVGEVVAIDARTVHLGLWLHTATTTNLSRQGRGMLTLIVDGNAYYVRLAGHRGPDLDLGAQGRLAFFVLVVQEVQEDSAEYATLTSGVTFRLHHPEQVVPRWQLTVQALRAARRTEPPAS